MRRFFERCGWKKQLLCVLLALLLSGCSALKTGPRKYTATYLDLFDTVTTVVGLAQSEAEFVARAQEVHDRLLEYHRLFDIYHDYEGLNNLKTVNDMAGVEPVRVDGAIIDLLEDCKAYGVLTGGRVNVAMGSVLQLWHDARSEALSDPGSASLPEEQALRSAAAHTSPDAVELDPVKGTVFISDPGVQLDVGAIAKGWAVQQVAEDAPAGLLITVGGNVCATGPKEESGTPWVVGIQDPDGGSSYLHTLPITGGCVVTSGDYQRFFTVDGTDYHHIIDPDTLFPSTLWRSVTIVCDDSGLGDALSTALFLLPRAEGQALLEKCGAEAIWLDKEGTLFFSPGLG